MTAETSLAFEALESQAARVMAGFTEAGYERVAPALLQPAGLFLDRMGEAIRARTYVFTDPGGEELCLRPDLTLPVTRIFLERGPLSGPAKYCYNGPAFRMQDGKPDPLRPREFRQAGIEYFGEADASADAEVFSLCVDAVRKAGLDGFVVKLGHIGLFNALLSALSMPERWRQRLARAYWRPKEFLQLLNELADPQRGARLLAKTESVAPPPLTPAKLHSYLEANAIAFIGSRAPSEVLQRLQDKAADAQEQPLPRPYVELIEAYLRLQGPIAETLSAMGMLFEKAGLDLKAPLDEAERLFATFTDIAGDTRLHFAGDFGRHFEYYTGMMFQIEVEGAGIAGQIAGGGRYDGLIAALTAGSRKAAAVGAAIHTERLLAAAAHQTRRSS